MFARSRSRCPQSGAELSLLEWEARTAAVRRSDTPSQRLGRGRVGEGKKQVHHVRTFWLFLDGPGCIACHSGRTTSQNQRRR